MGTGLLVAGALAAVTAVVVARFLPNREPAEVDRGVMASRIDDDALLGDTRTAVE
jgi:hypothetical protein